MPSVSRSSDTAPERKGALENRTAASRHLTLYGLLHCDIKVVSIEDKPQ